MAAGVAKSSASSAEENGLDLETWLYGIPALPAMDDAYIERLREPLPLSDPVHGDAEPESIEGGGELVLVCSVQSPQTSCN